MSAAQKTVTLSEGMSRAFAAWTNGANEEAMGICRSILAVRPQHQGARHLRMMLEHGLESMGFTASVLHDPSVFDIGDFSVGAPEVTRHNRLDEPARLSIGNYCAIGHDVKIYLGQYHRQDTFTIFPFPASHLGSLFPSTRHIKDFSCTRGGVKIGNDVWIGAHSIILSGVSIGDGAVIGAGSVVSRDVGPYEVWAGNPAAFRRRRFDERTADRLMRLRWWDWPKDCIEANVRDIMSGSEEALARLESVKRGLIPRENGGDRWVMGRSSILRVRKSESWQDGRPTWIILHGSLGSIESVSSIAPHLPEMNLLFVDLPGCGRSTPPAEMSVAGFAAELIPVIRELMQGDYRILGVSFGGTVGLQIARHDPKCRGVALLDSPFSAKKQWHNHVFLRGEIARQPDNRYLRQFALEIYGVTERAAVEREYWHLLEGLEVPVAVVTGDQPLLPPRPLPPIPCCLDEDDLARLAGFGARVVRISGGHDLINHNPKAVARLVRQGVSGEGEAGSHAAS